MDKILLSIFFLSCICLIACRQDNKKNNNNNIKKEIISEKSKLKNKNKKKIKNIVNKKKDDTKIIIDDEKDKINQKEDDPDTIITTAENKNQKDIKIKEQQVIPEQPVTNKSKKIQIQFSNDYPITYYFKEYLITDITPALKSIKASLSMLTSQTEYPIIRDANLTHLRLLIDEQELESIHIKNLNSLGNNPLILSKLVNQGNALKIMLFSKNNIKENIILPIKKLLIDDLKKIYNNSLTQTMITSKHMIDILLGNDNIYTKLNFVKFSSKDNLRSKTISMQTQQDGFQSPLHKLTLDASIQILLEEIIMIKKLKNLLKD
ncbi:hypothetical protein F0310_04940 (plasmid) [Borrelia sp. A-FGy1]|uniref:hypothetical protein n=1 Tax=Borrelia sp. A-FGy1 TaxID=2608247 RepID=UPI0015F60776|nr:hypothetical protein [Borrelia sp. A-FGy1]QMU99762.1 hypothetical protein F0310_04940 [Borrelia sp. A-FGy1]